MAQTRKTIFSLGGPEYLPDPRVGEAQAYLARGDQQNAMQAARGAQIATAQAAVRRAAIEAAAKSQDRDAARQLAELRADAALQEAMLREQGWTGREEMREEGATRRAREGRDFDWQKALMQAGLEEKRQGAMNQREQMQGEGADRRARLGALAALVGRLPSRGDAIEADMMAKRWAGQVDVGEDPAGYPAALEPYRGHPGYGALVDRVRPEYDALRGAQDGGFMGGLQGALGALFSGGDVGGGYEAGSRLRPENPGLAPLPGPTGAGTRDELAEQLLMEMIFGGG